jgi:signal transduction histidine kinase
MNAPRFHDSSLYELAAGLEQISQPLQVSPTTFKSMLSTVLDILIDEQLPATIWLKLPRGEVWEDELARYQRYASDSSIYVLHNQQTSSPATSQSSPIPAPPIAFNWDSDSDDTDDADTSEVTHASQSCLPIDADSFQMLQASQSLQDSDGLDNLRPANPVVHIPLVNGSQLRREYFLMVRSPRFSFLLLAHRPRSVRPRTAADTPQELALSMTSSSAILQDDVNQNRRRHPLLCICTFVVDTLIGVLDGLYQAIHAGQLDDSQAAIADVTTLLENWETIAAPHAIAPPDPALVGAFYSRQVKCQETIWLDSSSDRRLADQVSQLQIDVETLSNKLRIKDEFLKKVGQQMRAPLTNMITALTLLGSPNLRPNQRQRYMEMVTKECDRQSALINSVLELLQLEDNTDQAPMQPIRLTDVVPGVVSTYQPLAQERGVMLAYTIPDNLPAVSCLRNWLRQMAINLLHNAIKCTPKDGEVWVVARQQGDYIQLEFKDTGIGIAQNELPRIFDPFYRLRQGDENSGAGLGLSIVQRLAINCGGSVSVRSKSGEGSTFNVLLPIYNT